MAPDPRDDTLYRRLGDALRRQVSLGEDARLAVAGDESGAAKVMPAAVVRPQSTAQVAELCREAALLGVGLVPRGAGTGKAGGCVPRPADWVVDLSGMNQLLALRPQDQYAVVQPGMINADLDRVAAEVGFMYPPDPASRESCTLGGNVATNAGGPRAVKYGVTHNYVWGVELVLPGGEVLRTGRNSIKGVAGYNLASLIVGSEGTLGFVTEATLHIIPAPEDVQTAWVSFANLRDASQAADAVFGHKLCPRILELLDETAMDLVRPVSTFKVPPGRAAWLVETDGSTGAALDELTRLCEVAVHHGATDSAVAMSEKDREGMRRARRLVSSRMKEAYPSKISDDIAVPKSRIADLLEFAAEAAEASGVAFSAYGHLGDGNVHINLLCKTPEARVQAVPAQRRILQRAVQMGGTVSGEHGIGLLKRDQLPMEQSSGLIALQKRLKAVFDPQGIMNPGKVFVEPALEA